MNSMPRFNKTFLVTGGAGFIGSALIRRLAREQDCRIVNVDCLTYAGNLAGLDCVSDNPNYFFEKINILDRQALEAIFVRYQPDFVMHLAAESHVDRSIFKSNDFIHTNIIGTFNLLEVSKTYWERMPRERKEGFRYHQISTDEVYGDLTSTEAAVCEDRRFNPSSPYSATKASADHLVHAWRRTYGFPALSSFASNNYGPYQYKEKLIPLMIQNALDGKKLPVYGDGMQIRDWLHVSDHVEGLLKVIQKGRVGDSYNLGGSNQVTNIDVIYIICDTLQRLVGTQAYSFQHFRELICFVDDRLGHDNRYALDCSKAKAELNWVPKQGFKLGLEKTIQWYVDNQYK